MEERLIRVAVNGYGVIGKRVADAVSVQEDMDLVGIADVVSDYRIRVAVEWGYPIYASLPEKLAEMAAAGIPVQGTLDDLLKQVDMVVDCTPKALVPRTRSATRPPGSRPSGRAGRSMSWPASPLWPR